MLLGDASGRLGKMIRTTFFPNNRLTEHLSTHEPVTKKTWAGPIVGQRQTSQKWVMGMPLIPLHGKRLPRRHSPARGPGLNPGAFYNSVSQQQSASMSIVIVSCLSWCRTFP